MSKEMKLFRPADIILAVMLIAAGIALSAFLSFGREEGSEVRIVTDGKVYGTYPLDKDQTHKITRGTGVNIIRIKDGTAFVSSANCKGQDCVHESPISKTGETIVCLPHKVVVEITGEGEGFDAVAE